MNDSRIASSCQPAIKTTHLNVRRPPGRERLFATGMSLSNGTLKPIGRKMRVDLRRGQARVAQQLLNRAQIRATLEQIGRKGMAHRMRGNVGGDAGERRQHMEPSSEHSSTHAIAARRNKQRMQAGCGVAALCLGEQLRPPLLDIASGRRAPDGTEALYVPCCLCPKGEPRAPTKRWIPR